jgi:alcohol dehydrogenase (cytochrome c)
VADGKVFMGTLNAHVIALDARTGKLAWEVEAASIDDGYSYTSAPILIENKVVLGISGSDFGVRAFIEAYDAGTGRSIWKWWCVPGPNEPGHETWEGKSWEHGGGSAWMPITYDQETNTIYAGCGNPGPDLDGSVRKGDNLYTECTVALDANTGKLKWHFQMIPHDVWDLDNVTETVLDEITLDGQKRRVGMVACKNGYFYVLDAETGKCYYALQYVHKVNWGKVDPDGTPHPDFGMAPVKDKWTVVYPGASGGKEWCPVAYDPNRKRLFIPVIENPHRHKLISQEFTGGLNYWAGASVPVPGEGYGHLTAIDVEQKKIAWDKRTTYPLVCGVTCTQPGLVITGTPDQRMIVYDADTGDILHEWLAPSGWHSAPVVYEVDGTQFIAFANGWGGWVAGFDAEGAPELSTLPKDNIMYAFALADRLPQVPPSSTAVQPQVHPQAPEKTYKQAQPRLPAQE